MPYASLPRAVRPLSAAVAIATAVLLAGCAVGPDYHRPDTSIPAAFKEAPAGWKVAQPPIGPIAARGGRSTTIRSSMR